VNSSEHHAKSTSMPSTGLSATLSSLCRSRGSGALSHRRAPLALLASLASATTALALMLVFGVAFASAAAPTLTINPTVTAGYTTVEFSGEVDPKGDTIEWYDETSTDGGATWEFGDVLGFSEDGTPQLITNAIHGGLTPGTTYRIRITAFDITTEELLASPEPSPEFTTKSVNAPSITLDPITSKTDTTAVLKGKVDPNSPGGLDEEGKNVYATAYEFHCSPECPGLAGGTVPAEATGSELEIEAHATGLEPNKEYVITLSATNRGGEATDGPQAFTTETAPPTVRGALGASTGEGGYILQGAVNPHNSEVIACEFKYGLGGSFDRSAPCESLPPTTNKEAEVTARIAGLTVGDFYHYKLVVETTAGSGESTANEFEPTAIPHEPACANELLRAENHSLTLPECRAYELASSPSKAGNPAKRLNEFSEEGGIVYQTATPNANGSGSGVPTDEYAAIRGASGWQVIPGLNGPLDSPFVRGITAPGQPTLFSADLRSTLWFGHAPGENGQIADPYLRLPNGEFKLLGRLPSSELTTPSAPGHPALGAEAHVAGASPDLSKIVIEEEALGGILEYDVTGGVPRRADVDGEGHPCGIVAIRLHEKNQNRVSLGADVVFFETEGCGGGLWARVDGTRSYKVSESRCSRGPAEPCDGYSPPTYQGASLDGRSVYFKTAQQLVDADTDESVDLYRYELPDASQSQGTLIDVTAGASAAKVLGTLSVSDDGSTIYFVAEGVLAANLDSLGEAAQAGDDNLYVWRRDPAHPAGQMSFIGALTGSDASLWGPDTAGSSGSPLMAQTTADGGFLIISSFAPLVPGDTDTARDVYRYDAAADRLARLSTDTDGVGGNTEGLNAEISAPGIAKNEPSHRSRSAITGDGEEVVFITSEALSPADTNGALDAYLWRSGRLTLLTDGSWPKGLSNNSFQPFATPSISGSGDDIYIETTEPLSPQDRDDISDVYDLRRDGGFGVQASNSCAEEATCREATTTFSIPQSPSTTGSTAGNPPMPASCRHGKVRRGGKCVVRKQPHHQKKGHHKKRRRHHRKSAGAGNPNSRAGVAK
jgi:hypothetical protein